MVDKTRETGWQILGRSVRGAAHIRRDMPNQDALSWSTGPAGSAPWILAVSDGHGSARSFRSELGAAMAVQVLEKLLAEFVEAAGEDLPLEWIENHAAMYLPKELDYRWKRKVLGHLGEHPFSEKETETLFVHRKFENNREGIINPFLAYGTTALAVLVTDRYLLHLQLGDGDILQVTSHGEVRRPISPDERLLGNETTSLCGSKAHQDMRICFQALTDPDLELILISTDGYANSFRTDDEFRQVGPDLLSLIRSEGVEAVQSSLSDWLNETSEQGSGDDITLGILSRCAVPQTLSQNLPSPASISLNSINES